MSRDLEILLPWTLSGMGPKNKPLEAPMRAFLSDLTGEPDQHWRFLNMLSLMEHIGSRKIMLTQMKGILTQEILKHLAEETRHAFFFKRQAEKLSKEELDGYSADNTMCFGPAQMYFGRLDKQVSEVLNATSSMSSLRKQGSSSLNEPDSCLRRDDNRDREAKYLWMSLIVELRACWFYHLYQEVLEEQRFALSLKSVIAEEDLHLKDMYERLVEIGEMEPGKLSGLCDIECGLFSRFWIHLQGAQNLAKAA